MKLRHLIAMSAMALTLGYYSGAAYAVNTYEKNAVLKNGVIASFTMYPDKSECELVLTKNNEQSITTNITKLLDIECDGTVDSITFPLNKSLDKLFVRSNDYKQHKTLFNSADKLYNWTIKQCKLKEAVEKEMGRRRDLLQEELESFFK